MTSSTFVMIVYRNLRDEFSENYFMPIHSWYFFFLDVYFFIVYISAYISSSLYIDLLLCYILITARNFFEIGSVNFVVLDSPILLHSVFFYITSRRLYRKSRSDLKKFQSLKDAWYRYTIFIEFLVFCCTDMLWFPFVDFAVDVTKRNTDPVCTSSKCWCLYISGLSGFMH